MSLEAIHNAYVECYNKCIKALTNPEVRYVNIQHLRHGGYRLIASFKPGFENCSRLDNVTDWAQNIMYRLVYLNYFDATEVDDYFDQLEKAVGYKKEKWR